VGGDGDAHRIVGGDVGDLDIDGRDLAGRLELLLSPGEPELGSGPVGWNLFEALRCDQRGHSFGHGHDRFRIDVIGAGPG
jgi:hypothetical protein